MGVLIANCGHDERGQYRGGKAGDQTGTEYRIRYWYNRPWNVVLRHPDPMVQSMLARLARTAAENDHIGYDQGERETFYNALKKAGWWPSRIKVDCEADCSSSTAAIVAAAAHHLGYGKMQNINPENWTGSLRESLAYYGFHVLTASKYLTSDRYIRAGDILLNEEHHVTIAITSGSLAAKYIKYTAIDKTPCRAGHGGKYPITRYRAKGKTVKVSEWHGKWAKTAKGDWVYYKHLKKVS